MFKRMFLSVILTSTAMTGVAHAADESQPTTDTDKFSIGEIVVTAQKRSERLLDVPISITAVSADALDKAGAKNLAELQGVVPGVYFPGNSGYSAAPITIRGTAGADAPLLDNAVAGYLNGVYQPSSTLSSSMLLDVGTIEVVRGPQGTLQGRNATAGAIIITTPDPTEEFSGYIRASFADPQEVRTEGAVSGALSDKLGIRVAAGYYDERGWGHNTFTGKRVGGGHGFAARITLKYNPTENFSLRLVGGHSLTYTEPAIVRWAATPFNPVVTQRLVLPGTATPATPLSQTEQDAILKDNKFAINRPFYARAINDSLSLNMTYSLGGVDLISVTGFDKMSDKGEADSDGFARTDREGYNDGSFPQENFTQELRAQSNGSGPLSWIVGAYFSDSKQDMSFNIRNVGVTNNPPGTLAAFEAHQVTRSYAGFVDATYNITPKLAIIGGVRRTRETKDFDFTRSVTNFATGANIIPFFVYTPAQADWNRTNFRVKTTFKPIDDVLVYASYSTGFKSGGFNAFGTDPAFNPETIESAEAGVKAQLLDRRISIALAGYTNRYNGLQIRAGVAAGGVFITNAANSKVNGFEFEGTFRATQDLTLMGNIAYSDARFGSFANARNILDVPVDATGNSLPRAPQWQYFLQSSYTPSLSENVTGLLEASFRYRSRIFMYHTNQDSFALQGKPLGELGLRAGVTFESSQITLSAFGTNLTNARSVTNQGITFSYPIAAFNKPRSIGIQIDKKF